MLVSFEKLPSDSKIWIFQSNKTLTSSDISIVERELCPFLSKWQSHGIDVQAGMVFEHDLFLIVGARVPQGHIGGCGVDKLFHTINHIFEHCGIDLLTRNIAILQNRHVITGNLQYIKSQIAVGAISPNAYYLDSSITSKDAYETRRQIAIKDSFLGKYFEQVVV